MNFNEYIFNILKLLYTFSCLILHTQDLVIMSIISIVLRWNTVFRSSRSAFTSYIYPHTHATIQISIIFRIYIFCITTKHAPKTPTITAHVYMYLCLVTPATCRYMAEMLPIYLSLYLARRAPEFSSPESLRFPGGAATESRLLRIIL